jgi:alpha-tubulin suppressor-like RCC1 family protein
MLPATIAGAQSGIQSWGSNLGGQLGDGTTISRSLPTPIFTLNGVTQAAGGSHHSVALKSDGTVWSWGFNLNGQLGDGSTTDRAAFVRVNGLSNIIRVAAGASFSLALKNDGTVWVWGSVDTPDGAQHPDPVPVPGLNSVVAIACGEYQSLALRADGTVWGWGMNSFGQLGDGTVTRRLTPVPVLGLSGITGIACGQAHSLAVKSDGTVWAWGLNQYGQLGKAVNNSTFNPNPTPTPIGGLNGVTAVAGGLVCSLARKSDGTVLSWGGNYIGQLGIGAADSASHITPVPVKGLSGVISLAGNGTGNTVLALRIDGTVWAWGSNSDGQLGVGASDALPHTTAAQVSGFPSVSASVSASDAANRIAIVGSATGVIAIASGGDHSLALMKDGTVRAWGRNAKGQLSDGTTFERDAPVLAGGLTEVVKLAGGVQHSLALKADGTVWAWGRNAEGQLGDGGWTDNFTPVRAYNLTGMADIACGDFHSLALGFDGTVWAWGSDSWGQLGSDPAIETVRSAPEAVSGLSQMIAIAEGHAHSLALKADGTVWAWGQNDVGQLGIGTADSSVHYVPAQVSGLTNVIAIACGYNHSLALKVDGTVWAWGDNHSGALGTGNTGQPNVPVKVRYLTGVVSLAAGQYFSLALKADGTIWAWGSNDYGQLGDASTVQHLIAKPVPALSSVAEIGAGYYHSLALKSDGTVWAWGANSFGQIGNGAFDNLLYVIPIQVNSQYGVSSIASGAMHLMTLKPPAPIVVTQ